MPSNDSSIDQLRSRARDALSKLRGDFDPADVESARALLDSLRNMQEYDGLLSVAEAIGRVDPKDAKARRLYAQGLIETGKLTAAVDVLQSFARRLPKDHPEATEAAGLLGRAYKQMFFDSRDRGSPAARQALKRAVAAYRKPYESDPSNTWHGVNLLALAANCRRLGIKVDAKIESRAIAERLLETLRDPSYRRDEWYLPTLAEVSLGTGNWDTITGILREYVGAADVQAFQLRSTLRQFTEIWDLEDDERGRGLVNILRARLLELPGGSVELSPGTLQRVSAEPSPDRSELEALLGDQGPKTYRWWQTGLDRARAVAAIRQKLAGRIGTGFLARAADLKLGAPEELVVVTNFHVVNPNGATPGIRPEDAEVAFEAVHGDRTYGVAQILWCSPPEECDAAVLRLDGPVDGVEPMPIAKNLPLIEKTARVYVIGHPGGRDLAFSFQDNELLDHEGPPTGKPQIPGVCRVHYRAPTEGGSSGSPVFNANSWQVIALHHKGGKLGMPKLNGRDGSYAANEGISLQSIVARIETG